MPWILDLKGDLNLAAMNSHQFADRELASLAARQTLEAELSVRLTSSFGGLQGVHTYQLFYRHEDER